MTQDRRPHAGGNPVAPARLLELLTGLVAGPAGDPGIDARLAPMLEGLVAAFGADRALVLAGPARPAGPTVLARATRPGSGPVDQDPAVSASLFEAAVADRRPRLLTSLETRELKKRIASLPASLASILAAPLDLPAGPGLLYLDCALDRRRYREADRELLAAFARAAGDALRRDRDEAADRAGIARLGALACRGPAPPPPGRSAAARALAAEIARAGPTGLPVLLTGEPGCDHAAVARALHAASARPAGPFVEVAVSALPAGLLGSELFGHEKGAFTGARARRLGRIELADGGTLFLDGIAELPPAAQALLLRVLQERAVPRLGAAAPVPVDFRLVASATRPLEDEIRAGRFREDLYFRLAVYRLPVPPLRERGEDLLALARGFAADEARVLGRPAPDLGEDAAALILGHPWPGNLPELEHAVRQAVVRGEGPMLTARSLAPVLGGLDRVEREDPDLAGYPDELEAARRRFETDLVKTRIAGADGDLGRAAASLGITRRRLLARCRDLGLEAPDPPGT